MPVTASRRQMAVLPLEPADPTTVLRVPETGVGVVIPSVVVVRLVYPCIHYLWRGGRLPAQAATTLAPSTGGDAGRAAIRDLYRRRARWYDISAGALS